MLTLGVVFGVVATLMAVTAPRTKAGAEFVGWLVALFALEV